MPKAVPDAPARYRAFLSALRRTANAELAFRQSGVNRSWAYWRRKRDADFARDWAAALAAGGEFHRQIGPLQQHFEANSRDFRDLCYVRRVNEGLVRVHAWTSVLHQQPSRGRCAPDAR